MSGFQVLRDFSCTVAGVGYVGIVKELTLPKVAKKMKTHLNGGMQAEEDIPMGYEKMTATTTFDGHVPKLAQHLKANALKPIVVRFTGQFFDSDTGKAMTVAVEMRARAREYDPGSYKQGEETMTKIEWSLTYYKLTEDGETIDEIDIKKPFNPTE